MNPKPFFDKVWLLWLEKEKKLDCQFIKEDDKRRR